MKKAIHLFVLQILTAAPIIAASLLFPKTSSAQITLSSVSALVQDINSSKYVNCTYVVDFVPNPNQQTAYTYGGSLNFQTQYPQNKCDSFGNLAIQLPDSVTGIVPNDSKWRFTICSAHGYVPGDQYCFKVELSITGLTDDISAPVQAAAAILPVSGINNVKTNGVSNISQTLLNFVDTASVTWSNPSGGVEQATAVGALNCSPVAANRVVYINNSSACVTSNTLGFVSTNNTLTVGASGGAAVGTIKANGTSGSFGATLSTNSTGTQILLGANAAGFPLTIDGDSATTPVNYIRLRAESAIGVSQGLEFTGQGDVSSSGGAAGFKVTNAASVNGTSPGASNSLTAGNAQGTTSSPGGSNSLIAGNSSGTGASSPGGSNIITAGTASGGNNLGGDITLTSGNGHGTGRGGNVNLNTGTGTPNGQVLVNGAPLLGVVASASPAIGGTQTIGAAATTWLTQNVTMPAGGCPCRAFVSYGAIIGNGNSGVITLWVEDGTSQFATTQWLTNSASATGPGGSGAAFSPTTYANNAVITFNARGFSNASGSATIITTPLGGSTQASWMSIAIFTSI